MMITERELESLEKFYSIPQSELEDMSVKEIDRMLVAMKNAKNTQTAADENYAAYVRKWFTPYEYLRQWFSDQEIVTACAHCGVTKRTLTEELAVETQHGTQPSTYSGMEYLRTGYESIPAYTKSGQRLMDNKRAWCHVYRKTYQYQGLSHGDVIQMLLYGRHPWLEKYGFSCYEYRDYGWERENYEIYPKNSIYTPVNALMSGDIDAIKERNRSYARSYRSGQYTPAAVEKRFEENAGYFEEIQANIPYTGKAGGQGE